jgi:hypothetical protein
VLHFRVLSRTNSPPSASANSFRFCTSVTPPLLHHFGANNPFRFCTYRHRTGNPFRMRTYRKRGGGGGCHPHSQPSDSRTPPAFICSMSLRHGCPTRRAAKHILLALCFHGLTNCFSCNPFPMTKICVAPGCGPGSASIPGCAPTPRLCVRTHLPLGQIVVRGAMWHCRRRAASSATLDASYRACEE